MEPAGRSPVREDDDAETNRDAAVPPPVAQLNDPAAAVGNSRNNPSNQNPAAADDDGQDRVSHEQQENGPKRPEEEKEDDDDISNDALFALDPSMLELSEQEEEWAQEIRESIDGLPDVDVRLSDFMCAHLAIASKGDLEWAITRVYKMQEVRKEYKILGTYEEGCAAIRGLFDVLPGCILNYTCHPGAGDCFVMIDGTQPLKKVWKSQKNIETTIRGAFYLSYAEYPSLQCVRVGNVHVFEMDGYDWGKGMSDVHEFGKLTNETVSSFPNVLQHVRFYNTPVMANFVVSMVKKIIPKDVAKTFSFGHTFVGGNLRNFYLVPTPEAAYQRAYEGICSALKLRFESEDKFSLSSG